MEPLPRNLARMAGLGVAACAVVGLYLGASKAYSGSADNARGTTASADNVASAKAIAPPPPPTFDEAAIRRIAKEEAQGLVAHAQSAPAPARRRQASSPTEYTSPSDAGLVYARPPRTDGAGTPPATASSPPGQVEQF